MKKIFTVCCLLGVLWVTQAHESRFRQYHISGVQLISRTGDQENINVHFNEFGGVKYDYSLSVIAIRCCNPTHFEHAWCDLSYNHTKCKEYYK